MEKSSYVAKGTGWERDALEKIMDSFPENYITNITSLGKGLPYIQVKAGPYTDSHKTVKIAPLEGAKLMIFLTDMAGNARKGFLPVLATEDHLDVMHVGDGRNMTFEIKLKYDPDF